MRYTIKEHTKFRLRKPYRRRTKDKMSIDYYTADERNDSGRNLRVNVLIMAKAKKKNNKDSRVTAGDLFSKLGQKNAKSDDAVFEDEFLEDVSFEEELRRDSIDVSSDADEDDSDLDINELLRKYLPSSNTEKVEDNEEGESGGVLSKLKLSAAKSLDEAEKNDDEKLIDALDSAFSMAADGFEDNTDTVFDEALYDKEFEDEITEDEQDLISEYELEGEVPAESEAFEEVPQKKTGFFAGLFGKKNKAPKAEEQEFAESFEEPEEDEEAVQEELIEEFGDDAVLEFADAAPLEESAEAEPTEEPAGEEIHEPSSDEELIAAASAYLNRQAEIKAQQEAEKRTEAEERELARAAEESEEDVLPEEEAAAEAADEEGEVFTDEDADPTDINLMVAFGLDSGEDRQADLAKELGDRLEAKQYQKVHKFKLDRPEFVDKTQIPVIRKEFRDKEVSLWIRLAVCAVFTLLLLVFENITVLTGLFTGSPKQFAGVLDPAVYPGVYIMVSLQLMLLACLCAYPEIIRGFKRIFSGIPGPESLTAILTVAGIIYSAVLSHLIEAPAEPVMFNFVVALSVFLTLAAEICNNKRESMNFRVVANKKPKHIVRRLPDEESECEAKAFVDADDVCDVMKIEKTAFVDGFFARLRTPDSTSGIFMTFIMSAAAAIAILFGIFVNFRGGDSAMAARVIYSALLIIAPLSVYTTFSYPLYRANLAADGYDSAIIGETSLEEYSNASIISFDDKNVFPSYSVKVQNMRIYNNARIDRVLYYAASVFTYAGGPLQDVFEVATRDMGISGNVQIFDTESGFLASQVDGVNIIFGSCEALRSRGLEISDEQAFDDVDFSDELEIMYMFRENKLVAKMYIQYVMDADIDIILKQFSGSGLYVCVRTFDPNIDERMIARKLNMKRMPLKIVRYRSTDEVGVSTEKADSGLVTCGTPKSLLQVISYCGKVLHTRKTNIALSVLSVMIGVAILALLLLSDSMNSVNSLFIAIYQLIWLIPMMISSRMFIR